MIKLNYLASPIWKNHSPRLAIKLANVVSVHGMETKINKIKCNSFQCLKAISFKWEAELDRWRSDDEWPTTVAPRPHGSHFLPLKWPGSWWPRTTRAPPQLWRHWLLQDEKSDPIDTYSKNCSILWNGPCLSISNRNKLICAHSLYFLFFIWMSSYFCQLFFLQIKIFRLLDLS